MHLWNGLLLRGTKSGMGIRMARIRNVFLFLFLFFLECFSYYHPGVVPNSFSEGQEVVLKVNSLTSALTAVPKRYYDLPFCRPSEGVKNMRTTFGEILIGDVIENSPFQINMHQDVDCRILCTTQLSKSQVKELTNYIHSDYRINWVMDSLPVLYQRTFYEGTSLLSVHELGFPLGSVLKHGEPEESEAINNHIIIIIYFNEYEKGKYHIVGFEASPDSTPVIKSQPSIRISQEKREEEERKCISPSGHGSPQVLPVNRSFDITWSYSVVWKRSKVKWEERWDSYMEESFSEQRVQGFTFINSLLIVVILTGIVAMIMGRALRADLRRYSYEPDSIGPDDLVEETGWKLVHGDVFRPPAYPLILAALVGSGAQIFCVLILGLITTLGAPYMLDGHGFSLSLFPFFLIMGFIAGWAGGYSYRHMGHHAFSPSLCLLISFVFPVCAVLIQITIDFCFWVNESRAFREAEGVPFLWKIIIWSCIWILFAVPATFFGHYVSLLDQSPLPVRVNYVARVIPPQPFYLRNYIVIPIGGFFPFSAVFFEVFFLLSSILLHQYFTVFGFLCVVFIVFVLTCAEIAIVSTYFQLCAEDYHWWWRVFLLPAFSGAYIFIYALFYMYSNLPTSSLVPFIIYTGYTLMGSTAFALMSGSIGYLSSLWFVKKIYRIVKAD